MIYLKILAMLTSVHTHDFLRQVLQHKLYHSTPEGRAVSVTRELDLSLLCRILLFGRHLVSLAKIAKVWPPFFLATETPDMALEYTSREILRPLSMSFNELNSRDH